MGSDDVMAAAAYGKAATRARHACMKPSMHGTQLVHRGKRPAGLGTMFVRRRSGHAVANAGKRSTVARGRRRRNKAVYVRMGRAARVRTARVVAGDDSAFVLCSAALAPRKN